MRHRRRALQGQRRPQRAAGPVRPEQVPAEPFGEAGARRLPRNAQPGVRLSRRRQLGHVAVGVLAPRRSEPRGAHCRLCGRSVRGGRSRLQRRLCQGRVGPPVPPHALPAELRPRQPRRPRARAGRPVKRKDPPPLRSLQRVLRLPADCHRRGNGAKPRGVRGGRPPLPPRRALRWRPGDWVIRPGRMRGRRAALRGMGLPAADVGRARGRCWRPRWGPGVGSSACAVCSGQLCRVGRIAVLGGRGARWWGCLPA